VKQVLAPVNAKQQADILYMAAISGEWSAKHKEDYNQLDQELPQAKLLAERQCCKIHAGKTPWTPILMQAIQ